MDTQSSLMCMGSEGWPLLSNPMAETLNAYYDRQLSEHTVLVGVHGLRPVSVPMPKPLH